MLWVKDLVSVTTVSRMAVRVNDLKTKNRSPEDKFPVWVGLASIEALAKHAAWSELGQIARNIVFTGTLSCGT